MKKLILLFVVLINTNLFADYYMDLAARPGVNLGSTLDTMGVKNNGLNLSLGAELGGNLGYITAGGGIQYNNAIDFDGGTATTQGTIKTMPYYAYARFNLFPIVFKPYFVYKMGVNQVTGSGFDGTEIKGGTYWAAGFGIDVYNLLGEVQYQNSKMTINGQEENLSQISLVLGLKVF